MADLGLRYIPGDRPAMTRQEMNDRAINKYKLKVGKTLKVKVRNPDNFGMIEIRKAKIIFMHPYYFTCANVKHPSIKYTLYYHELEEKLA